MGIAMIGHQNRPILDRRSCRKRRGISLLEVIACTALIAILLVPIAGVIRASGRSMQQAQNGSKAAELRSTLRWLRQTIDEGRIVNIARNSLQLQLSDGRTARVSVQSNDLVLDDGTDQVLLAGNVRDVRFQSIRAPLPPRNRVGLEIRLRGIDSSTGQLVSLDCTVAETPQI